MEKVDEALGLGKLEDKCGGCLVLIEDCVETSAAFIINHIIKRSLSSSSSSILLVSLSFPFSHYLRILRKLGCNLATHRDNGRFIFLDQSNGNIQHGGLMELYGKIQKAVEDIITISGFNKSITIILDDFSLIEVAAKGSFNQSLDFLRYCHTLTSEIGSLVVLNHEDMYLEDESSTSLLQMEYLASVLVKAEPLSTGPAADVHGQLTILNKGVHGKSWNSRNKAQNFHFRIKENGVECFYPGTCS